MDKNTITIDIGPQQAEQLASLLAGVPLATRHAVARTALAVGLIVLTRQVEKLPVLISSMRRQANIGSATIVEEILAGRQHAREADHG